MTKASSHDKTGPVYVIDTNAFIVFENIFDPDHSQPVWDFLSEKVDEGFVRTIDDVIKELEKLFPTNKITQWVSARRDTIKVDKEKDHYEYLQSVIVPACPGLFDPDIVGTLFADPELLTVISRNQPSRFTLVTDEARVEIQPNTNPSNYGLPNRCDALKIPYIHGQYAVPELFKRLGMRISGVRSGPVKIQV